MSGQNKGTNSVYKDVTKGRNDFLNKSDEEQWEAFKQGSEEAFMLIYENSFTSLFRYGKQFTLDESLIEDTIQDLFVNLRTNSARLGAVKNIKAYLFVSFRRLILRYKKKATFEFPEGYSLELVQPADKIIIDNEHEAERKANLHKALNCLTNRQREAIYYFYFENMSYKEVQHLINLDHIKSTRNLIYEALKILKNCMSYLVLLLIRFF